MDTDSLIELVRQLTPEQQETVRKFIEFLKSRKRSSPFLDAAEEFMREHPELLRLLAK